MCFFTQRIDQIEFLCYNSAQKESETMKKLCDNFSIYMNKNDFSENDFFLNAVGFNDFHDISPIKTFHVQNFYTLHFILSGKGILEIYGKTYYLKQYDMFFIPPNVSMRYYPDEKEPWSYIWFETYGDRTEFYRKKIGFEDKNAMQKCNNPQTAYSEATDFLLSINKRQTINYYTALSLFYRIIDTLSIVETKNDKTLKEEILTYIDYHFHNSDLKIENICQDFNISHSYLCKLFNGDETVKTFLIKRRIEEAKKLLLNTDLTISEVGYSVGYNDNVHFMKYFKKQCGTTAGKYRKEKLGKKNFLPYDEVR